MATIQIMRNHQLGEARIRDLSEQVANKLASKYGVVWHWQETRLMLSHSGGANGHLQAGHDRIEIELKLGFLLSAFRASIEQSINEQLDKLLGPAG